jgi:tRNA-dihydrouridine synthase 3
VLWRFVELLREHFGADERGQRRILGFLPWHLDFFSRYRPLPENDWAARAREHPLLQTRLEFGHDLAPLEALLRDGRAEVHQRLAEELLAARERDEALERAERMAASLPPATDAGPPVDDDLAERTSAG